MIPKGKHNPLLQKAYCKKGIFEKKTPIQTMSIQQNGKANMVAVADKFDY